MTLPVIIGFTAASTFDSASTAVCLNLGCHESNPVLQPFERYGAATMLTVGGVIEVGMLWATKRWIAPNHPKIARVIYWSGIGAHGAAGIRNVQQIGLQRQTNARRTNGH